MALVAHHRRWMVFGCSSRGQHHAATGLPCQDAHAVAGLPGGAVVLVVADGAGSAPRSDQGAALAVEQAAASLASLADRRLPRDLRRRERLVLAALVDA